MAPCNRPLTPRWLTIPQGCEGFAKAPWQPPASRSWHGFTGVYWSVKSGTVGCFQVGCFRVAQPLTG
jgi:hypothetical protein